MDTWLHLAKESGEYDADDGTLAALTFAGGAPGAEAASGRPRSPRVFP